LPQFIWAQRLLKDTLRLDRTMWGSDHLASVEPQGLIKLVKGIRELEIAYGDGIKKVTEAEKKGPQKIERLLNAKNLERLC
jgi:N-acetylneuraminate synthase